MDSDTITKALFAARDTRRLEMGIGVLRNIAPLFRDVCPGTSAVVVADPNTMRAAGNGVHQMLAEQGLAQREPLVIEDRRLCAEMRFVEHVENVLRNTTAAPIAVGAGTVNDIVKLAAHRTNRPYVCVATAASMDGYTAYGASITHRGAKQTFDCPAPVAVLADLDVIAAAPPEMAGWGYADLLAKITAGADWILADALGVEPIDDFAWKIVQTPLRESLRRPAAIRQGHRAALGRLTNGLMLGGFAMQTARSSRPASGAEHQFSHLWDMEQHEHEGKTPSHGAKVGIATLAISALYEMILSQDPVGLDLASLSAVWTSRSEFLKRTIDRFPDNAIREVALRELGAKTVPPAEIFRRLTEAQRNWESLVGRLRSQLLPFAEAREMLFAAGAPVDPESIGISRLRLRDTFLSAFLIRRRFTVLDFAVCTDWLDPCLKAIFGPAGPWPIQDIPPSHS